MIFILYFQGVKWVAIPELRTVFWKLRLEITVSLIIEYFFSFRYGLLALPASWPNTQINQAPPQTPRLSSKKQFDSFIDKQRRTEQNTSSGRYYCWFIPNSSLLSLLVFTIPIFEVSIFKATERQYPRVEKDQVCKIFQRLCYQDPPTEWLTRFVHSF